MAFTSQLTTSVLQVEGRNTEGGVLEIVPGARLLLDVGVDSVEGGALLDDIAAAVDTAAASAESAAASAQAAAVITGIDSTDAAVAALVSTSAGPETQAALSATIEAEAAARVEVLSEPLNLLAEGCVGDGATDDSAAFSAAFEKFLSPVGGSSPGRLVLPAGRRFYLPSGYAKTFSANLVGGVIEGGGEIVTDVGTAYALKIEAGASTGWRQFAIKDIRFTNAGVWLKSTGGAGNTIPQFDLERLSINSPTAGHGLFLDGVFECRIKSPNITMAASATTFDGIKGQDGSAILSSIDIENPNVRNGRYGISSLKDTKVRGGTVLTAQMEGILISSGLGALVDGVHVENCWQSLSPVASAALTTDNRAGVQMSGIGTVQNVYATQSSFRMSHAVSVYASKHAQVIGGASQNMKTYLHVFGSQDALVVAQGVPDYTIHYNFTNVINGRFVNIAGGPSAATKLFDVKGAVAGTTIASPTGGATVDTEARAALDALLTRMKLLGLVP